MRRCEAPDCHRAAAVCLHVPWGDDRLVCPAHARGPATRDGVVPEPLAGHEDEWP